jgi:hypothetical protein|tara:strand:- start:10749 stop:11600 length:852 start_codon:yes stop_codon:yes gene_type:complete
MSEKKKKKVLSQTLEDVRRGMEKTDESLGGLASDVTGVSFSRPTANATTVPKALLEKAVDNAGRFKPVLGVLQENLSKLNPDNVAKNLYNQAAKYSPTLQKAGSAASKFFKFVPPAEAAALAYRSSMLVNSEEERQKARDEAEEMYKRGGTVGGNLQNMGQGFLDPAGTIYAAGDAAVDTVKTLGGLAYDKFFGPSEEEQREAAKFRRYKRNRDRDAALRNARMSPEERAESADRAIASPDQGDLQKILRSGASSVHRAYDKKADDLRKLMEKPYDGLTSLTK